MVDLTPAGDAWLSPDYLAVGLALAASFALARYGGSTWIVSLWLTVGRVARRPLLVLIGVALLAGGVAIALSALRLPVPLIQDEFSYLLAADTFVQGRFTNPTHPLWHHFETYQVIHEPTYMSKYPPAQGVFLAVGQWLTGSPLAGAWLATALAVGAVCWMLQGWLPRRWALLGSLLLTMNVTLQITWGQTYWGGQVAAMGGALVYGALPRIFAGTGPTSALMLGLGVVLLANSRPYEGLIVCAPAALALLIWFVRRGRHGKRSAFTRVVIPTCAVLVLAAVVMGGYNHRVTGNALRMPYMVYEETYMITPLFVWGTARSQTRTGRSGEPVSRCWLRRRPASRSTRPGSSCGLL